MTSNKFFANSVLLSEDIVEESSEESSESEDMDMNDLVKILNPLKTDSDFVCTECNSDLMEEEGIMICSNEDCGLVGGDVIDSGPEWRSSDNANRGSCPSNHFFPRASEGTIMSGLNNHRLQMKQQWIASGNYRGQRLSYIFDKINKLQQSHDIPKVVIDDTKIFYNNLSDCRHRKGENKGKHIIIRGNNVDNVLAACMSKAGENNHWPMNTKELSQIFDITEKRITAGKKKFDRIIDTTDNPNEFFLDELSNISATHNVASDYIKRYGPRIGVINSTMDLALTIAGNCWKLRKGSNHSDDSLAGGIILLIMSKFTEAEEMLEKKTMIAKCFNVSEATINKVFNQLEPLYEVLISDGATSFVLANYDKYAEFLKKPKK